MSALASSGNGIQSKLLWAGVAALGTVSFGIVALTRGESVNAAWLIIAAVCIYFISYRFYALWRCSTAPLAPCVTCRFATQAARLMVGIPDYEMYVRHRQAVHPGQAIMTYEEFFRERRDARYAVSKDRFRACC